MSKSIRFSWNCGRRVLLGCSLVALLAVGGCGPDLPDLPTVEVKGKVTHNGSPVAGAEVGFINQDTKDGKPANGKTLDDGSYTLTTLLGGANMAAGALPGEYKVIVTKRAAVSDQTYKDSMRGVKMDTVNPDASEAEKQRLKEEMEKSAETTESVMEKGEKQRTSGAPKAGADASKEGIDIVSAENALPERYSKPDTSGLVATVKAEGGNDSINFDLKDAE